MVPEQAQISWLDGRYDKYTVHRIHIHRIFHFQKISEPIIMDGFLKFWGLGGWLFFELEIWRHGVFSYRISTGETRVYSLKKLIKLELMTPLTTSESGYKTCIYQSVMFLYSFVDKNQQNVGWNRVSEALTLQNFLFLLWKQPHKLFCSFNAKHGLLKEDAILIFEVRVIGSDCWPRSLKFKMMEMKIQLFTSINLPSVHTVIKDILILMFCTSLGQC